MHTALTNGTTIVEWQIADQQIAIYPEKRVIFARLQARSNMSLCPHENLQAHVYFSVGNQQMITNVMSPLGMSGKAVKLKVKWKQGLCEPAVAV